ncbi:hypothetical protein [Micromonospora sp. HM5-17]|nr:hypothetical protein [Micromonospora sp. HM5-17]
MNLNLFFTAVFLVFMVGAIGALVVFYAWWRMPALRDGWERWRSRNREDT